MTFLRLHLLTVFIVAGAFCASSSHGGGLLDHWSRGGAAHRASGGYGTPLGGKGRLQSFAAHGVASHGGLDGYPAAASPYPTNYGGSPYAGNPWENGGTGYVNFGDACCGPHWWDFMAQAVFLTRDDVDSNGTALMSQGIRGFGPPNVILSTGDADFNFEPAFRVGGRFQTSAVHSVEAIYLGGLDWDDRIVRTTNSHDFFSVFSDFGNSPFGGFEDSDQASITSLDYDSELDSVEVNYRKTWILPDNQTHGSWVLGVRYVRVDESLRHRIDVLPHFDPINMVDRFAEFTQYDIATQNDLVGPQFGAELVHCLSPGITLGGEAKVGVFANNASQDSLIDSTTLTDPIIESASDTGASFMSDANVFALWQIHPLWKIRVGYEVMLFTGLATAGGNYNTAPPSGNVAAGPLATPLRQVDIQDHDDLVYHGFHLGVEFGW